VHRRRRSTEIKATARGVIGYRALLRGRCARRATLIVAALAGAALLSAAPALAAPAAPEHVLSFSFGGEGTGAGELLSPGGVAVSPATNDVYVADSGNHRIDEFEADGTFIRAWGWGVADGLPTLETCTALLGCQQGLAGSAPGQFESPATIAIDDSAGPSAGDVYVGDTADNLITKFTATGELIESWGVEGQLNGSTTSLGSLAPLAGVAVDSSGELYAMTGGEETRQLFKFTQAGGFLEESEMPKLNLADGLAINQEGDLFKVNFEGSVQELTATDGDVGTVTSRSNATGVAVDRATGDLYVDAGDAIEQYVFEGGSVKEAGGPACPVEPEIGCAATESFGVGDLEAGASVGVNSSDETLYVVDNADTRIVAFVTGVVTGKSSARRTTAAVLNGTVEPKGSQLTACRFEYVTKAAFEATGFSDLSSGGEAPCVPPAAAIPPDSEAHAVSAEITGLKGGEEYDFRLAAGSAKSGLIHGNAQSLTTAAPPSVIPGSAAARNLTASSVDLEAQVNPDNGGTTYRIEYGPSTAYSSSVPVPEASIGEGEAAVRVTQHVTGLSPNTTYHWRVVATNSAGSTAGADHTFIYDETGPGLPDGRAYEMVTPPNKNGALIGNYPFDFPPQVSADGSRVILGAVQCFASSAACTVTRQSIGALYAFTRDPAGWSATSLAPPASEVETTTYVTASADTGMALFSGPTPPNFEDDFYARQPDGEFVDIGPLSPPAAGRNLLATQSAKVAANADFSHVVFQTEPVWSFSVGRPGLATTLLEYDGANSTEPAPVGVSGGLGSDDQIDACSTILPNLPPDSDLSADGRVVYFAAQPCGSGTGSNAAQPVPVAELYARVDGGEAAVHTVSISEPRAPQAPAEPSSECTSLACHEDTSPANEASDWRMAEFGGTSNDGSKVLFASAQQLTDTATQDPNEGDSQSSCHEATGENGCNLYLYDFALPSGHRLLDISHGSGAIPGGPRVQGVLAFSSDGSHAYFVAKGVLTAAPRAACVAELSAEARALEETSKEGRCRAKEGAENVYVYERDEQHPEGHLAFIASLDEELPNGERLNVHLGSPSNVTPDGQFLVFTAADELTADDTRPDTHADGALQVFRYDAANEGLIRVSIGERGFNDDGNAGAGNAFIVPGERGYVAPGLEAPGERRLDPTMSDDGSRIFFMSPVALAPGALSSVVIGEGGEIHYAENVYEWEQAGVGSCPASQAGGCVFLISDGRDTTTAPAGEACIPSISSVCLIGSDASGANVFFATADPLLPADGDTELDLYDARICEPQNGNPCIAAAPSTTPCLGEACHGTPPPTPSLVSPGSASFNGSGNLAPATPAKPLTRAQKLAKALKACKKDKRKAKRKGCEASARRKYGPLKKAKRSSNDRRAKS
jgi:DNA-binding beta-propeller fold protein YncE